MKLGLAEDGVEIRRGVVGGAELERFRVEADRVAREAGSACVRHLRSKSEVFDWLSVSKELGGLLPEGLEPVRSILFDKTPDENWPVLWHQDLTIAVSEEREVSGYGPWSHKEGSPHVQPPLVLLENMVTIRLHLDDAPEENGALRVVPGSHKGGKVPSDVVAGRQHEGAVTCECEAGDVLLMSPLILHSSRRSLRPGRRRVLHFEYARRGDLDGALRWRESRA